ncbi:hypothetical protein P9314_05165 [Paenibacillus validus]|uniref:hypothetical protein n=1 Tax=Paenibacillus validus TaxID=44253 RepID=UPI000FD9983D|nr:hypothetical protein [Paenibacillus validus]MED4600099.1 hypothetical protein [Paenibacillus validus]MED4605547.1 hypothetical protein [Paenibacillus validus]
MEKTKAIEMAYQIATLTHPGAEVMELLAPIPYERTLELLLILRMSSKPVKSPLNFLRRAIAENWTPETLAQPIDRKTQNDAVNAYMRRGMTREEAEARYASWRRGN